MNQQHSIRLEVVDALVNAMFDAAADSAGVIGDSTASEVVSAALTVTLRMVKASIARGADPDAIRRGVDCIYLACAGGARH